MGLVQRKRERAVLRAIGATSGQEQAVIIANAGLLGLLVSGLAVLRGIGLTYLWSLGSPAYYGIKIEWVCCCCRCEPEWRPSSCSSSLRPCIP